MDITRPRRDAPAIRLTSAGIVAHPNRMVNRINARIIPHRSPPDNFHQHAPQRRPHILIFLRSVVAILLLAICAVAAAAQTGADSSSIRAIQAALQARDNEKALTLVRTQLQAWPKDVRLWALEGIALTQLGRNHEALIAYNKALALSPDYLAALEGAAELEYKAGSIRAVPLLNRILKVRPDEPTTHAMLAALAYKKHECAAAVGAGRIRRVPDGFAKAGRSGPCFRTNPGASAQRSARSLQSRRRAIHRAAQQGGNHHAAALTRYERTRARCSGPRISSLRRNRRDASRR